MNSMTDLTNCYFRALVVLVGWGGWGVPIVMALRVEFVHLQIRHTTWTLKLNAGVWQIMGRARRVVYMSQHQKCDIITWMAPYVTAAEEQIPP